MGKETKTKEIYELLEIAREAIKGGIIKRADYTHQNLAFYLANFKTYRDRHIGPLLNKVKDYAYSEFTTKYGEADKNILLSSVNKLEKWFEVAIEILGLGNSSEPIIEQKKIHTEYVAHLESLKIIFETLESNIKTHIPK